MGGQRHISQTTELPSGEHLTTKVEWTKDTMRNNKAILTVNITPNREFKGIIDWHITPAVFIANWNGKTEFAEGPLAVVSPMDTFVHFNFDKNHKTLDADMTETFGGKKWGVTISKNKFSLLTGGAA